MISTIRLTKDKKYTITSTETRNGDSWSYLEKVEYLHYHEEFVELCKPDFISPKCKFSYGGATLFIIPINNYYPILPYFRPELLTNKSLKPKHTQYDSVEELQDARFTCENKLQIWNCFFIQSPDGTNKDGLYFAHVIHINNCKRESEIAFSIVKSELTSDTIKEPKGDYCYCSDGSTWINNQLQSDSRKSIHLENGMTIKCISDLRNGILKIFVNGNVSDDIFNMNELGHVVNKGKYTLLIYLKGNIDISITNESPDPNFTEEIPSYIIMENELCNVLKYLCFREIKGYSCEEEREVEDFLNTLLFKSDASIIDKKTIPDSDKYLLYKYDDYKDIYDNYCIFINYHILIRLPHTFLL